MSHKFISGNFLKNVENRRGLSSIMKIFGDFTYDQVCCSVFTNLNKNS